MRRAGPFELCRGDVRMRCGEREREGLSRDEGEVSRLGESEDISLRGKKRVGAEVRRDEVCERATEGPEARRERYERSRR